MSRHFSIDPALVNFKALFNISSQLLQEKNQPSCQTNNEIKFRLLKKKKHFILFTVEKYGRRKRPVRACIILANKHISFCTLLPALLTDIAVLFYTEHPSAGVTQRN